MIELMVVLAVLAMAGAAAFAGFRQDELAGRFDHWMAETEGAVIQARNMAIDEQTQVTLKIFKAKMEIHRPNPTTKVVEGVFAFDLGLADGGALTVNDRVCTYGILAGIQTPRQAGSQTPPSDCMSGSTDLTFQADGTVALGTNLTGVTIWIADRRITDTSASIRQRPRLGLIQVFPGGLIRTYDDLEG